MNEIRVSEYVTIEKVKQWNDGDIITITAGMGAGKSYFIKNFLCARAELQNKKILMLIHRNNCVSQFQKEIERNDRKKIICIKTYQSLENMVKHKIDFCFDDYTYIVCDEYHYWLSDASFNKTTDLSLELILAQTNKIRIFMSATGEKIKDYLMKIKKLNIIHYELPIDYSFIKTLSFFYKDETMEEFIKEAIEKNQKGIFFIRSAKKAYELYKKFSQHCLFNCSKSNEHYQYVDYEKIDNMLTNERFDELILITTLCLDAGVNIIDTDVKHIVLDVDDVDSLTQCLGRRRIQNDKDKLFVYIKGINNKQLGGIETQLKKKIKMADFLKSHTVKEYVDEFPRETDKNQIVYDITVDDHDKCGKKINELMYFKCQLDINTVNEMKKIGEYGYCKYLASIFGFYKNGKRKYIVLEEKEKQDALEEYLGNIVNQRLLKDEQKELIKKMNYTDYKGRIYKSIKTLNASLEEAKIPYYIISNHTKDKERNDFTYWVVLRK